MGPKKEGWGEAPRGGGRNTKKKKEEKRGNQNFIFYFFFIFFFLLCCFYPREKKMQSITIIIKKVEFKSEWHTMEVKLYVFFFFFLCMLSSLFVMFNCSKYCVLFTLKKKQKYTSFIYYLHVMIERERERDHSDT